MTQYISPPALALSFACHAIPASAPGKILTRVFCNIVTTKQQKKVAFYNNAHHGRCSVCLAGRRGVVGLVLKIELKIRK